MCLVDSGSFARFVFGGNTTDAACLIGQSLLRDEKEPELAKLLHDRSTGQDYYYHPYLAPTGLSQWRPQVANTSHDTC